MSRIQDDTKTRLLEAAEKILIEEGVHALTVRRIGAVSGLTSTLITYHFGALSGLLSELCRLNLEPMIAEWQAIDAPGTGPRTLRRTLRAWLGPLTRPAAFTPGGRSLIVFDEIASHGDATLKGELLAVMIDVSNRVQSSVQEMLPHLPPHELRARMRFIAASALGPPPRFRGADIQASPRPIDSLQYLVLFAEAALTGPAAEIKQAHDAIPRSSS